MNGWINLKISDSTLSDKIHISIVYPPFNNLLNFLEDIIIKKESKIKIDEEGNFKIIEVKNTKTEDNIKMSIQNSSAKPNKSIEGIFNRQQFVNEFLNKIVLFEKTFNKKHWNGEVKGEDINFDRARKMINKNL